MKNKAIALALLLTIVGCSESNEESAAEAKKEAMMEMEKAGDATAEGYEEAKEKTVDAWDETKDSASSAYEDGKDMASDAYEDGKDMASDAYEDGKEKGAEMMDAGAEKVRKACIAMKKKMGGDVSECDSKD